MTKTVPAPSNNVDPEVQGHANLTAQTVTVTEEDMPLHCPSSKAPLWSMHPRVFLDIVETGSVKCPYCGTVYNLAPGAKLHGHGH